MFRGKSTGIGRKEQKSEEKSKKIGIYNLEHFDCLRRFQINQLKEKAGKVKKMEITVYASLLSAHLKMPAF